MRAYRGDGTYLEVSEEDYSCWEYEVVNHDTVLGLAQWVENREDGE